jgi:hypothetical protein
LKRIPRRSKKGAPTPRARFTLPWHYFHNIHKSRTTPCPTRAGRAWSHTRSLARSALSLIPFAPLFRSLGSPTHPHPRSAPSFALRPRSGDFHFSGSKKGLNTVAAAETTGTGRKRRSTAKTTHYTYETSEEDLDSSEEEELKEATRKAAEEEAVPDYGTIDKILGRRRHPDFRDHFDYLIKYKRTSYRAIQWVPKQTVLYLNRQGPAAMSRFDNKVKTEGEKHYTGKAVEDLLDNEGWDKPDRIVARRSVMLQRPGDEDAGLGFTPQGPAWKEFVYLAKWKNQPYVLFRWTRGERAREGRGVEGSRGVGVGG